MDKARSIPTGAFAPRKAFIGMIRRALQRASDCVSAEERLIAAMIERAVLDAAGYSPLTPSQTVAEEQSAKNFVAGWGDDWCRAIDMDPDDMRRITLIAQALLDVTWDELLPEGEDFECPDDADEFEQ